MIIYRQSYALSYNNFATSNKNRNIVAGKEIVRGENHDMLLECDNENTLENENVGGDVATEPEVGMIFNSEKEMFDLYKRYAYAVGFPVRK